MTPKQLRIIQVKLNKTNVDMAKMLHVPVVSYCRFVKGNRKIPAYIEASAKAHLLLSEHNLLSLLLKQSSSK